MAFGNMINNLTTRLQTLKTQATAGGSSPDGTPATPQDGNAGSAQPARSKWHLLWTGPALDPQGWRDLAQGVSGKMAQAGARTSTQAACAGTQLPGLQFLPHAENSRFFMPDGTEVRTGSGQAQDGRHQGSVAMLMADHRQVAVEEVSGNGPTYVRASAIDGDKHPIKAGVIRNPTNGHPEVHFLNPGNNSITMIDLTDYHTSQGGEDQAKLLAGAPDGWVQARPAAAQPQAAQPQAAPPQAAPPPPPPQPQPAPAGQSMDSIIMGS